MSDRRFVPASQNEMHLWSDAAAQLKLRHFPMAQSEIQLHRAVLDRLLASELPSLRPDIPLELALRSEIIRLREAFANVGPGGVTPELSEDLDEVLDLAGAVRLLRARQPAAVDAEAA